MTTTIPGPFSAWAFPRRKFTIRSYSLTTLRLAKSKIRTIITKTNAPTAAPTRSAPWSVVTEPRSSRPTTPHMPCPPGGMPAPRLKAIVGFHAIIFLADWHAYINDKLSRNLENLRICAEYFKDGFRAVGVPDSVEYLYANEFVRHPEYWQTVIQASKASTVARIRRALTIMGRKE